MRAIRLLIALLIGISVVSLGTAMQAMATLPGTNGKIALDSAFGEGSQVFSMDPTGANQTNLTNNPGHNNVWPSWSPDATKVAFSTNRDGQAEIYVMDANGTNQTRITTNAAWDTEPSWSPDATKIAFSSNRDGGDFDIFVMNADGSSVTNLTTSSTLDDREPAWSPDGSKIAFDTNRSGNYEIETMNANGSSPTDLTNSSFSDIGPSWSPDGMKIVFDTNRSGNYEIETMNANGTSPTDISNDPKDDTQPSWSPDGTKIAFVSTRATAGSWEIFVMNAAGGAATQLTFNSDGAGRSNPDWQTAGVASPSQPDGQIKRSNQSAYTGDGIYNLTGTGQTVTAKVVQGSTMTFDIKEQNDGSATDSVVVKGPGNKTGFTVQYLKGLTGTTDITSQVVAGTYTISNLASRSSKVLRIVIAVDSATPIGTVKSWVIVATSTDDSSKADAVRAKMNVNG